MKYNLLIVEDHELTRYGLKTTFENVEYIGNIFEAAEAQIAFEFVKNEKVDVVIMDLGLPGMNGIDAIRVIKQLNPKIKFIVLTSHSGDEEVVSALKAGSHSYCSKEIKPKQLVEIVEMTLNGASWFDPKVSSVVLNMVAEHTEKETKSGSAKDYNLTGRETQVLKLMSEGHTNQEIAKKLYVSVNTTKAHVCSILQKLSVEDRTQAVIKVLKDNII